MRRKPPEPQPPAYYQITISERQFSTIRSALNHSKLGLKSRELNDEIEKVYWYLIETAKKVNKPDGLKTQS